MANSTPGDYLIGALLLTEKKGTSAAVAKGDVLTVQSNAWNSAITGQVKGPFMVAAFAQATADGFVTGIAHGIAYVTAQGAIQPGALVMAGTSVFTSVSQYVATNPGGTTTGDIANAGSEWLRVIGRYIGHENEGGTGSVPTAAADTDVIRIQLRDW